ncbi:hypothetical protein KP509_25G009600 [Ceratopteris richardii]|uniref:Fe2OG dioxygenase domain-containing protein n=1 Tax=Ceratopteris richardii TaxID=49495 RepID=A0A8T2RQ87_CERRI|nr:hypothetical protein KP509_25G009600 [Ceratopteris richardii]
MSIEGETCTENNGSTAHCACSATHGTELLSNFVLPPQMRPLTVRPIHIPLVDLALLENADTRPQVLDQIHKACCEWGFFQVVHHGVSLDVLSDLRTSLNEFFSLPLSAKSEKGLLIGDSGQGYGTGFVDPKSGATEWKDYLLFHTYPTSNRDYSKWPSTLRNDIELVSGELLALSQKLLAIISESLGLPSSSIENAMGMLHQKILAAHYPPCPQPEVAMGSCEHTDIGIITCVWQASEDVVSLQVLKDEQWHSVEPNPSAIVVNIGDQIQIFSNGKYRSGPHRVVLNASKPRLSVVAFHNPSASTLVSPSKSLVDEQHPPKYNPTLFKDYANIHRISAV